MKSLYLLIDFCTIIIPFVFSFHPRLQFYKTWKAFFPAVIVSGIFFISWDIYFTSLGVWGFNEAYLTGLTIINLPVEEVLFFFCIPYACVFTFHCLTLLLKINISTSLGNNTTIFFIICFIIIGIVSYPKLYPTATFLGLAALLAIARFALNVKWLAQFYWVYAILLLPFLIVNGILTGAGLENPIVWYNEAEIIGVRIITIPVEDVFYGMGMILMNLLIYRWLLNKKTAEKKQVLLRPSNQMHY